MSIARSQEGQLEAHYCISEAWVVEDVSFPIASEFGYVRESRKPTLAAFAAVYAILPLKLLVAGLFQLSEGPQFLARAVRRFRKT